MKETTLAAYTFGELVVQYVKNETGVVGLRMLPASRLRDVLQHRETLLGDVAVAGLPTGDQLPAATLDPLVHVKIVGDASKGGFTQGITMRGSASTSALRLRDHLRQDDGDHCRVVTTLGHPAGWQVQHILQHTGNDPFVRVHCELTNSSPTTIGVELLTSFNLTGISPFSVDYAAEALRLHRFRSHWSAEGRHEARLLEDLHLERSWAGFATVCERFGQVGSMPVRGWFPFIAVEDVPRGVFWGAQLAWSGSWQMEISRDDDFVSISGGLADREFGHWLKHLAPGESLVSPGATLAAVNGDLDDLCHALLAAQEPAEGAIVKAEEELPVIFNEWCTTWGNPTHDKVIAIADAIAELGVRYLVLDAGWYAPKASDWGKAAGDWIPNSGMYPDGLAATAAAIRERGLVPGLWFEFECIGPDSEAWSAHQDHQLTRDRLPLASGNRRFWDMRDPWCHDYLEARVIDRLRECGFGYLKVDYNDTIGIGADGADSHGEALRQHVEGVLGFFRHIRRELPELTIESCSSGGHRLEPLMMSHVDMGSFSDAHEGLEIPIIAASLQRLILPRQSQIWAVLRGTDGGNRLLYSLAATFLGRMCLSGDIGKLSASQLDVVRQAIGLYGHAAPIIRRGKSRHYGPTLTSWRAPQHWQAVLRTSSDERSALVVLHTFSLEDPQTVTVPLPKGDWEIAEYLANPEHALSIVDDELLWHEPVPFTAAVVLLRQR